MQSPLYLLQRAPAFIPPVLCGPKTIVHCPLCAYSANGKDSAQVYAALLDHCAFVHQRDEEIACEEAA